MSQEELDNLISVCWHDSQYKGGYNKKSLRCWDRGITELVFRQGLVTLNSKALTYVINWSDDSGDPEIYVQSLDEKIHMSGDGEWDYGIYKSENQVKLENRDNKIEEILN